ncbi:MAG: hypothetical protein AAF743_09750 [Planctomycetota bacterium]
MSRRLRQPHAQQFIRTWFALAVARLVESPAYDPTCPLNLDACPELAERPGR